MAIIGGAGNPVGGSFTGPAEALEIIGDHAYAYSGKISVDGSGSADTVILNFTSGNYYLVGDICQQNDDAGGDQLFFQLSMNNNVIMNTVWDSSASSGPGLPSQPWSLIIPPYTEVELKVGCSTGTKAFCAEIVGRIYRTRD